MPLIFQRLGRSPVVLLAAFFCLSPGQAAGLDTVYRSEIRPLLDQFCFECHAEEDAEADINLDSFRSVADIRRNTCLLYTSPSPRDVEESRMPSSA